MVHALGLVQVIAVGRWEALGFGVIVGAIMVGAGVLVDSVARRAADGSLPRNKVSGIRSRATMASDEAWLAAHQAAERLTRVGAWASIVGGFAGIVVGLSAGIEFWSPDRAMAVSTGFILGSGVVMTVLVVLGGMVGNRVAREL